MLLIKLIFLYKIYIFYSIYWDVYVCIINSAMQGYNNIVMWGSQKRQAFRLQIRNRQVRHKLNKIRMRFIDQLSDNILVINDLSQSEQEHTRRIVTQIKQQIDAIAQLSKSDNYQQIYAHVNHIIQILGVQQSMHADNNNNNYIKNRQWARLCLNQLMGMYGEQIVMMVIGQGTSDDDSSEEQYPYEQEQQDIQYRKYCGQQNHTKKPGILSKQHRQHYITYMNKLSMNLHQRERRVDLNSSRSSKQNKYLYQIKAALNTFKLVRLLGLQALSMPSCVCIVQALWTIFQKLPIPSTSTSIHVPIQQKYLHVSYSQIISTMMQILNSLLDKQNKHQSRYMKLLVTMGIHSKIRYIIEYIIQVRKILIDQQSQHMSYNQQDKNVIANNMDILHAGIVEFVLRYQEQSQSKQVCAQQNTNQLYGNQQKVDINLHQFFTSYCLYVINQLIPLQTVSQYICNHQHMSHIEISKIMSLSKMRLFRDSLQTVIQIISYNQNIQLIDYMQVSKYASMLPILQLYCVYSPMSNSTNQQHSTQMQASHNIHQAQELLTGINYLVLRLVEIVTDNEKNSSQLIIQYNLLHYLQFFIKYVYDYLNQGTSHYFISHNTSACTSTQQMNIRIGLYVQTISRILCNLLQTSQRKCKQTLYNHSILQTIFQCLKNTNNIYQLLPLISIYQNYFLCFGSKVTMKNMHIFLDIVAKVDLSLQLRQDVSQVRDTISNIYARCRHYLKDHQIQIITNMFRMYGMDLYIQLDPSQDQPLQIL